MEVKRQIANYIAADLIASATAWFLFNIYRYQTMAFRSFSSLESFLFDSKLIEGQVLGPLLWIIIFFFSGYYKYPFQKSRIEELSTTLFSVAAGSLLFFFAVLLDDVATSEQEYIGLIRTLFLLEFSFVYFLRYLITRRATIKIHKGEWGFNTLIVGIGKASKELEEDIRSKKFHLGYKIEGHIDCGMDRTSASNIRIIGKIEEISSIIKKYHIEHIILAPDEKSQHTIYNLVALLQPFRIPISIQAGTQDILYGKVRMKALYDTPMISVTRGNLSASESIIKRSIDIIISLLVMILFSPVYLILAILVRRSQGPVFYSQQRIGKDGIPFDIYKFRTMLVDAEKDGPTLAHDNDPRVTPLGAYMRKYRLDELPQFWNILKGEMSLVGPRPEREFYIRQIMKCAPYYCLTHQVRPGLTSWGMVKFGYASTVEQMIERLKYDILYLENISLIMDCKILIYTIRTVITGKGI